MRSLDLLLGLSKVGAEEGDGGGEGGDLALEVVVRGRRRDGGKGSGRNRVAQVLEFGARVLERGLRFCEREGKLVDASGGPLVGLGRFL